MERTLSLPVLQEALGPPEPGELPSPEELMRLIADIEIGAIMSRFDIPDEVLRTAWYLHGVCAQTDAARLYTPARQGRAFAVSAHIFDLALADDSRTVAERLSLAFGAQIGYRRAEQDPNATAVYRRVADLLHGPVPLAQRDVPDAAVADYIETLALEAGVAFLGFQTGRLQSLLRHWQSELRDLARRLDAPNLQGTMFGPAQAVVNAVADLVDFLIFGSAGQLNRARTRLEDVVNGEAGTGDLNARWVAVHLLDLIGEMAAGSLHQLLPPDTPAAVAQAFTLTSPPVLTLWPPQRELLARGSANPLDPATARLLISVPTSAGKSLMSQLVMCTHLATVPGRVIYVSPLRSLTREMRRGLRGRLRVLDRELGVDAPDFPMSWLPPGMLPEADREADIEVLTPERLMHALRNDPEGALDNVTLIVVDEAHHIAQGQRGFLLEGLLAFCQTHPAAPRLVLLSAAVGNGAAIAHWLDPDEPDVLFASAWRGPRRLHGLLTTNPLWDQKTTIPRKSKEWPLTAIIPMNVHISIRPTQTSGIATLTTSEESPLGQLAWGQKHTGERHPKKDQTRTTAAYKMFAHAATLLLPAGSMLVVTGSRVEAQRTAMAMAGHLPERDQAQGLAARFAAQLGEEHPLVGCVRHGIAFHHAALPTDVLEAVEDALRTDEILAVVSTSTLTDGVNLPVRTVVILAALDDGEHPPRNGVTGLDTARLLNAVGRAGRAGRESEGWILLALNRRSDPRDHDLFTPDAEQLQVQSALTTEQALADLAEAEQLIADTADGVMAVAPTIAGDFVAFVWFVLNAHDILDARLPARLEAVDRLLAMQQLPEELKARWYRLADHADRRYRSTDPATRRRWAATGTSLSSARTLEDIAKQIARRVALDAPPAWGPEDLEHPTVLSLLDTLGILQAEGAFDALLALPERRDAWRFYNQRAGSTRLPVDVDLQDAISAWINGETIPNLARQWLPNAPIDWALEQAVTNISTTFEHYLSWTLGALINMVNGLLADDWQTVRLRPDSAWFLRYGVNTEQAIHLLVSGIHSRRLAHAIGRNAAERHVAVEEMRTWLADQHLTTWRQIYDATPPEIDDLIEYVRKPGRSLLRILLTEGEVTIDAQLQTGANLPPWPTEVTLRWADAASAQEIIVEEDGHGRVGLIAALDHADVMAILRSGLLIAATLERRRLTISRREPEA